jgi:hypothetical protein
MEIGRPLREEQGRRYPRWVEPFPEKVPAPRQTTETVPERVPEPAQPVPKEKVP